VAQRWPNEPQGGWGWGWWGGGSAWPSGLAEILWAIMATPRHVPSYTKSAITHSIADWLTKAACSLSRHLRTRCRASAYYGDTQKLHSHLIAQIGHNLMYHRRFHCMIQKKVTHHLGVLAVPPSADALLRLREGDYLRQGGGLGVPKARVADTAMPEQLLSQKGNQSDE
jgi:hypothetical protein